ncbi:MAG: YitT family protein, partial [Lachnospiraceae bacterium]
LYAVATIVISNFVLDAVLYRGDGAKLIYVISDYNEVIAGRVMKELDLGATYIDGEGAYTNEKKRVLMVVAKTLQYSRIREIVKQEDKDAFVIVSGASEVFGYGYKDMFMQEI